MTSPVLSSAQRTIQLESEAILGLANLLTDDFEKVINTIHQRKGRFVISGIGKSAIVAQKIVATLNSTGTPSIFMHAADAIHGDLGMIMEDDAVMIISKSGESAEIKVLVPLIKNFGNPLIAMVGSITSYLAKQSDYVLDTTVSMEACTNNLAPTSSTTAQMVLGDAIAVCLMELNGFSGNDFAKIHPGGNLGKRLYLRVKDLFADNPKPKVLPLATLKEVIVEMTQKRLGTTAVVDEHNNLTGIITDGDLRRMLEKSDSLENIHAENILSAHPKTINEEALAVNALGLLRQHNISQLVVTNENNKYMGILHLHDLVREGII